MQPPPAPPETPEPAKKSRKRSDSAATKPSTIDINLGDASAAIVAACDRIQQERPYLRRGWALELVRDKAREAAVTAVKGKESEIVAAAMQGQAKG